MRARDAVISVNEIDFNRAVTVHMSAVTIGQLTTDDMFEGPRVAIDVLVDGETQDFAVLHVVTDYWNISGMVLTNTIMADNQDDPNTLEYVLLKVFNGGYEVVQQVFRLDEDIAVNHAGRTTMDLLAKLYLE
jgi:hypothetical protein